MASLQFYFNSKATTMIILINRLIGQLFVRLIERKPPNCVNKCKDDFYAP